MGIRENNWYVCIDLKSFFASVECIERGLDPMTARLVVADPERGEGTICLAVSPAMKKLGVKNRCRVYEIPKDIDYIKAPPRMQKYIDYAATIYGIYLRYISPDDIFVYSIDECFIDVTPYLKKYRSTALELGRFLMDKIASLVGIRATCGVGTNLYLAKIALDITAKHSPDFIGELTEQSFTDTLWTHTPLTDFWRIGPATMMRLERMGIRCMKDIAFANEDMLYDAFGIDAELMIDHAWGRETTTMKDIKNYRPTSNSLSSGQVLMRDYGFGEAKVIVREMVYSLCLDMVKASVVSSKVSLYIGYSKNCPERDAFGSVSLDFKTNADGIIIPRILGLYDRICDRNLPIRRINVAADIVNDSDSGAQMSLFGPTEAEIKAEKNKKLQTAVIGVREKYGKNAILPGTSYDEVATGRERNRQIGGHKSGE
ncbi:MAG: DNA repair protein [Clostridia bacterium]|nr:DNA repair protein [Clostridia bacterium]